MKIGIDTDGVLTDMATFSYELGKKHFKREPDFPDKYTGFEMFNFKPKHHPLLCLETFIKYAVKLPPREHSRETLDLLDGIGHELYCITSRMFVVRKNIAGWISRHFLLNWYKKNRLNFKKIILCEDKRSAEEKLRACIRHKIDIMIDDKPEIAEKLSKNGIKVLLFDAPYNKKTSGENITRVFSWHDVEEYILKFS